MENSILTSTKNILGVSAEYTAFDLGIITHINSVFSTLAQLGVGPSTGFAIDDAQAVWGDFADTPMQLNTVRTYVFLRVRMLFDPPTTSFLIDSMDKQIKEIEWRLNTQREWDIDPIDPMEVA